MQVIIEIKGEVVGYHDEVVRDKRNGVHGWEVKG